MTEILKKAAFGYNFLFNELAGEFFWVFFNCCTCKQGQAGT